MINILVPTDFSDLSKVALQYAVKLGNKLNGRINLVHVVNIVQPTRASMRLRLESLEEELIKAAKEDMEALVLEVSGANKSEHVIKHKVVKGGSFNTAVKSEAKRLKADLIIMGTGGASGLKKVVMGSNTASVIEVSNIPTLVIPEKATFKPFKKILYATDLRHIEEELQDILPLVKLFNSSVSIFHMASSNKAMAAAIETIRNATAKVPHKRFEIVVVVGKDVDKALEDYERTAGADILLTFTHEVGFFDKLFNRSVTRQLAFHSKLPLLALRQRY